MTPHPIRCLVLVFFVSLFAAHRAKAGVIKALEFNVDGVLPSAESDIQYFNNDGSTESSAFSVSGGFLRQRTFDNDANSSYTYPTNGFGGDLDATLSTTIEARVNILRIAGNGGVFIQAIDGVNNYTAVFTPLGINLRTPTGEEFVPLDVIGLHTYKLESPGSSNALQLYVDGDLVHSTTAGFLSFNGFNFGDTIFASGNKADADWDYVRVSQAIPEPSTLCLATMTILFVSKRRSR